MRKTRASLSPPVSNAPATNTFSSLVERNGRVLNTESRATPSAFAFAARQCVLHLVNSTVVTTPDAFFDPVCRIAKMRRVAAPRLVWPGLETNSTRLKPETHLAYYACCQGKIWCDSFTKSRQVRFYEWVKCIFFLGNRCITPNVIQP